MEIAILCWSLFADLVHLSISHQQVEAMSRLSNVPIAPGLTVHLHVRRVQQGGEAAGGQSQVVLKSDHPEKIRDAGQETGGANVAL